MNVTGIRLKKGACSGCDVCRGICPMGLDVPYALDNQDPACIGCLYCDSACPVDAIVLDGELGFFGEQLRQYDRMMRDLFRYQ